jgi:mannose-6-phosphate isomerase-like protein (cupin superfamily)
VSFAPPPHPYPADRYHGDSGAVSATVRRNDAPHDLEMSSGWCDYLATGASTRRDYGLYRWHMSGPPSGPSPHFHRSVSESFFVLDGEIELYEGTTWTTGRPGDFLFVPEGGRHGFRNESGEPATMLILFSPGAPRERYFEGLVELATTSEPPSDDEMAEFYRRHDTFWVD